MVLQFIKRCYEHVGDIGQGTGTISAAGKIALSLVTTNTLEYALHFPCE